MRDPSVSGGHDQPDRPWDIAAAGACLVALATYLFFAHAHRVPGLGVETDFAAEYVSEARSLVAGGPSPYGPHSYHHSPPGYPLLLAAASLLVGDFFVAGKLLSAIATALLGVCTYALLKRLFDCRTALCTTILLLLALVPFGYVAANDVVGALAITVPIWLVLRDPRPSRRSCFLAGLAAGAAYLIRANAVFLVPGLAGAVALGREPGEPLRRTLGRLVPLAGGFALITFPWFVANWRMHGSPLASTAYIQIAAHFYAPTGDAGIGLDQVGDEFRSLGDVIRRSPLHVMKTYVASVMLNNPKQLAAQGLGFPAYLFAGGGLLLVIGETNRRRWAYGLILLLGYLLLGLVGYYLRYYLFLLPFVLVCVVYGLFKLGEILPRTGRLLRGAAWGALAAIAICVARDSMATASWNIAHDPRYLIPIADSLRRHAAPDDKVFALKPQLAYMAGLSSVFRLAQSGAEFAAAAREIGARYVVYSDYEATVWPPLTSLKDPDRAPAGLRLYYRDAESGTLVYEVSPAP